MALLALDDVLEHLSELALGSLRRLIWRDPGSLPAAGGVALFARGAGLRLFQPTPQRALLDAQDLVQPLPDVFDDGGQIVAVEHLTPSLAQPSQQVLQARRSAVRARLQPSLEEIAQRLLRGRRSSSGRR